VGFTRKATFLGTGGLSGLFIKANSKKERTANAMEKMARGSRGSLRAPEMTKAQRADAKLLAQAPQKALRLALSALRIHRDKQSEYPDTETGRDLYAGVEELLLARVEKTQRAVDGGATERMAWKEANERLSREYRKDEPRKSHHNAALIDAVTVARSAAEASQS
jgi:hypothetical protein